MIVFIGIFGTVVTILTIVALVLLTPRGVEPVRETPGDEPRDRQGSELSPLKAR